MLVRMIREIKVPRDRFRCVLSVFLYVTKVFSESVAKSSPCFADPDTDRIFSQPPLISFKRDKNIGNFLVRSVFQTSDQPGTFKCARARCKTCPFIRNVEKISGPKRSIKITDHFTCTPANVIYCITCTLCKKLYIGETGRRLGDRFREHLSDVEKDDQNASKSVARHFNLPNHSNQHMVVCGLSRVAQKAVKL